MENQLRIRVRIGDSEVGASYPVTTRTVCDPTEGAPQVVITLVKAMVEAIKKEKA